MASATKKLAATGYPRGSVLLVKVLRVAQGHIMPFFGKDFGTNLEMR
jgi:hypothetical protein